MKAIVYTAPLELQMLEVEKPRPGAGEVLIRVHSVGICGSELEGFASQSPRRKPPLIMGHEFSGIIAEVGEGVSSLSAGDEVYVNPIQFCGKCPSCRRGEFPSCSNRLLMSMDLPGAFAEFALAPAARTYKLPSGMSLRLGALVEPTAVAVRAVRLGYGHSFPATVLIFGAGTIGILCAEVAKAYGKPRVMIVDKRSDRLALAAPYVDATLNSTEENLQQAARAFTDGEGFAVAIDAVGVSETRSNAVALTRAGGTAVWCGIHSTDTLLDGRDVVLTEKVVRGAYCYMDDDFQRAAELLAAGAIKIDTWTRDFSLEEGIEQFLALTRGETDYIKAILHPA